MNSPTLVHLWLNAADVEALTGVPFVPGRREPVPQSYVSADHVTVEETVARGVVIFSDGVCCDCGDEMPGAVRQRCDGCRKRRGEGA
jgi:hypothetical protein